jgi:hypothetical protein
MKRAGLSALLLSLLLCCMPAASVAKPQPPSFAVWWSHFSAGVQRDVVRINHTCQKRYGVNDRKVGACFVKHERASLRSERAAWEKQIRKISRPQRATCKKAIRAFGSATRKAAVANLRYLDSHQHAPLTVISRDLNGQPFEGLKSLTFATKSRAVRICG